MKKGISLLLSLMIITGLFSSISFPAMAKEDESTAVGASSGTTGNCTWSLDDEGTLIISGNGAMGTWFPYQPWGTKIKKIIIEYGVTSISGGAFCKSESITSITIPDSVKSIGNDAFAYCTNLTSITIPNSVASIGSCAFQDCTNLENITLSDSITNIEPCTFFDCYNLKSITIPGSVTSIGREAFINCYDLSNIIIPDSVTSIGGSAFHGTAWYYDQPDGLIYAGKVAYEYKGTMPDNSSIVLKDGTKGIAGNAFFYCQDLVGVTIPNSVINIGEGAFWQCRYLTDVSIPDSVTRVEYVAFEDTAWFNNQPDGLVYAGKVAYSYKGTMPENTSIVIKEGTKEITEHAFQGFDELTSITIPDSVSRIGAYAFDRCINLKAVMIPDSVEVIEYETFHQCTSLQSVYIGSSVKSIGGYSFSGCSSLKSIIVCPSVKEIAGYAFYNCYSLQDVYYGGSDDDWDNIKIDEGNDCLINASIRCMVYNRFTVQGERFSHNLQYYAKYQDSTEYNPELAHLMMTMSNAAYNEDKTMEAYDQLGLSYCIPFNYGEDWNYYGSENSCYNIGSVQESDGTVCVLVSIRGSGDIRDFGTGTLDWMGNFDLGSMGEIYGAPHKNFNNAMLKVYQSLNSHLYYNYGKHIEDDDKNFKFFITGHSRGAAIAQLLELNIIDAMVYNGKKNVYGYNFAVPDTCVVDHDFNVKMFNNIFNVSNLKDIVSYLPGFTVDAMNSLNRIIHKEDFDSGWRKFGVSVWFEDGTDGAIGGEAHDPDRYLQFMRLRNPISGYTEAPKYFIKPEVSIFPVRFVRFKVYATYCPVDVELVDSNGKVIASVINGVVDYHDSHFGEVIISVKDDHKMFAVPADVNCTLRIVGNDKGTMDYYVAETDMVKEEVYSTKAFENVTLENGKEMTSVVSKHLATADTQLFVVDENESKTKEILADGTEVDPIFMNESKLVLTRGTQVTLTAESKDSYRWYSTDENVATVENGVVTLHEIGEANIIAETVNGAKAICNVSSYVTGDINDDNNIDILDATLIQKNSSNKARFTEKQSVAADVNGDGIVDILDATEIQKYAAGKIGEFKKKG